MKTLIAILYTFFISMNVFAQSAEKIDYSQIKLEHLERVADKTVFTDEASGETYRVENKENTKGLWIQITSGGKIKFVRHGPYYSLSNGIKTALRTYEYGKLTGLQETYYSNGGVTRRYYTKNGLKEGRYEYFGEKGDLVTEEHYAKGDRQGTEKNFINGVLTHTREWKDGALHGAALYYNSSGKIEARKQYLHGKQVGETQYY